MDCRRAVAIATFISTLLGYELFLEFVKRLFGFITEASFWFVWGNISELFWGAFNGSSIQDFLNSICVLLSPASENVFKFTMGVAKIDTSSNFAFTVLSLFGAFFGRWGGLKALWLANAHLFSAWRWISKRLNVTVDLSFNVFSHMSSSLHISSVDGVSVVWDKPNSSVALTNIILFSTLSVATRSWYIAFLTIDFWTPLLVDLGFSLNLFFRRRLTDRGGIS